MKIRVAKEFGFENIQEPLIESAPLALQWSKQLCSNCASYHGAWQVLRLLGVINSMHTDDEFILAGLKQELQRGAGKILISGAADYALQARIALVCEQLKSVPDITVIDICDTPLELNRWYAERYGISTMLVNQNILDYRSSDSFDLICTHSFLPNFNDEGRKRLIQNWWNLLAPGGAVLTAQRIRADDNSKKHGFDAKQADEMSKRAYRLAVEQFDVLAIEPDLAASLAHEYANNRQTFTISDENELVDLFEQTGFVLEHFDKPELPSPVSDAPSVPSKKGNFRWQILARKPVD